MHLKNSILFRPEYEALSKWGERMSVSFFKENANLSNAEFKVKLISEYGDLLKSIEKVEQLEYYKNVRTIKNILIFFAVLAIVSLIVTLILATSSM